MTSAGLMDVTPPQLLWLAAAARTLSANRFRQLSRDPAAPVWAGLGRGLATGLLRGKQVEIKIFSQHLVL